MINWYKPLESKNNNFAITSLIYMLCIPYGYLVILPLLFIACMLGEDSSIIKALISTLQVAVLPFITGFVFDLILNSLTSEKSQKEADDFQKRYGQFL